MQKALQNASTGNSMGEEPLIRVIFPNILLPLLKNPILQEFLLLLKVHNIIKNL